MNSDKPTLKRVSSIVRSVSSIRSRLGGLPVTAVPRGSGHASTSVSEGAPTGVNVNPGWASKQTGKRLQASLYHESMHVQQLNMGMNTGQRSLMEFHAHSREMRHAMKHGLYSERDMQAKRKKLTKYAGLAKSDFPKLAERIDRQMGRIESGEMPTKRSVNYYLKRL